MVAPAMPTAAREILRQLGREQDEGTWPGEWGWPGGVLTEPKPVFPRVEPERQTALIDRWTAVPGGAPAAAPSPAAAAKPATSDIAYEDFQKLDLRAAKVTAAERVAKADKLLKLTLDVGGDAADRRLGDRARLRARSKWSAKRSSIWPTWRPGRSAACCRRG